MPHINYRRGETRRRASEYPYSDATYALCVQTQANVARRHEGRRLAFAALAAHEADQAQAAADAIEAANVEREANIETEGPMRLWTVTRTDAIEYDQYSMFVVAAPTAGLARRQSPSDYEHWDSAQRCFVDNHDGEIVRYTSWTQDIDSLTVTEIGSAVEGTVSGTVLCASFNAG